MVFEVTQSLAVTMNGFQTTLKTRFDVVFLIQEKTDQGRVYLINKSKIVAIPIDDNNYLKVIEDLEQYTYPIKIETNNEGHFKKILDHTTWLKEWEQKTLAIVEEYGNSENVKDMRNNYLEVIKNESLFITNKFKEPFWNLLFFNPPLDNVNNPDIGTKLNWNVKSIGTMPCIGRTKVKNPASKIVIINFESLQKIPQDSIDNLQEKIDGNDIKWENQKINLQVDATFDTINRKIINKKALFEFIIPNRFSYIEEIDLVLKKDNKSI
jgi:hypothetical protein